MRIIAGNTPQEILEQLTEAAASYSRGRSQQDDRTAAILRYMPKQQTGEMTQGIR